MQTIQCVSRLIQSLSELPVGENYGSTYPSPILVNNCVFSESMSLQYIFYVQPA